MQHVIFLSAEWRDLVLLNYEVDPGVLKPRVPKGTELDFFQDRALVSVVGFRFLRARIVGIPVFGSSIRGGAPLAGNRCMRLQQACQKILRAARKKNLSPSIIGVIQHALTGAVNTR